MADRMTFHVFSEFGWNDGEQGLWRNERLVPRRTQNELDFWIDIAQTAERGLFDTIFLADAVGMGGYSADDYRAEVRDARMLLWDPTVLLPALGKFTEHLGFVFTSSILQDHPFSFARRASTLDELTGGRVGWNVVTSYSPNAAHNFGLDDLPPREERYAWAQEYVDATYALWESSWEEGAIVRDLVTGNYIDPDKVHRVDISSPRYRIEGPHLTPPTPQRTPLILQAGASIPGRAFAARNAEVVFIPRGSDEQLALDIADMRRLAGAHGRKPEEIKFTVSAGFIIGGTEQEARRKADEIYESTELQAVLADFTSYFGIDLQALGMQAPVEQVLELQGESGLSSGLTALVEKMRAEGKKTVGDMVRERFSDRTIVGGPEQIADRIQDWHRAGVDGVSVATVTRPGTLHDFVDQVMPELQRRGIAQREYTPGTLRHKLMGYGDRVPESHPAARYRR